MVDFSGHRKLVRQEFKSKTHQPRLILHTLTQLHQIDYLEQVTMV